jgi:hypothetical protein
MSPFGSDSSYYGNPVHAEKCPTKPSLGLINRPILTIVSNMADLKLQVPVTEEVEVDSATLARIDRGIKDANEGRSVPLEEVRKLIPKWISKFESPKAR